MDEGISFVDLKATLSHFARRILRLRHRGALPALILPLHRTVGGDGRELPDLRRQRMRGLQGDRLDGDPGFGNGASRSCWRTAGSIPSATPASPSAWVPRRIAMNPLRDARHSAVLRGRHAVSGAVRRVTVRRSDGQTVGRSDGQTVRRSDVSETISPVESCSSAGSFGPSVRLSV